MGSHRQTINISANVACELKHKGGKKSFLLILVAIFVFFFSLLLFFLHNNLSTFRNVTLNLNERGIRYDTFSISFTDLIVDELREEIEEELSGIEYKGKKRFSFVEEGGDIEIGVLDSKEILFENYLIPVGHLYWLENEISRDDLKTKKIVTNIGYGALVGNVLNMEVEEHEDLVKYLKENEEGVVGFVVFDDLNSELQILSLDGKYFLDERDGGISFKVGIKINSAPDFLSNVILNNTEKLYGTIPNNDEIVKINMSGVTALSRNLAFKIEASGDNAYPARLISDFLGDADIIHTSNEVSFMPNCIPERTMRFCSHPKYIETLEAMNVNVIELTGNHNNDFGAIYSSQTIEMYKERGWDYYGGGLNTQDAQKILYKELKDSKIAFLGYNYYDSINNNTNNLAGENWAGANPFSFEKMKEDIEKAKEENAFVILTFQFQECYSYPQSDVIYPVCYKPLQTPNQEEVFKTAIDYGADIVIGSQAHQPQTFEIYKDKPIFYGTGNTFFDQIMWIGTRQGMVLTHYVYKNKLLQTKISTTIYDNDMQTYVTTGEQRDLLLQLLKEARD